MRNAGLEEAQARIKIAGRNINNLRYADDATLMAESEEAVGPLKTDESGWRVLTKCGPPEMGKANHFSILALRTP